MAVLSTASNRDELKNVWVSMMRVYDWRYEGDVSPVEVPMWLAEDSLGILLKCCVAGVGRSRRTAMTF